MGKTIQFVEKACLKVVRFEKEEVVAKQGALRVIRLEDEYIFRVVHFGTVILELNYDMASKPLDCVTRWHIQSITDANYINTAMRAFGYCESFRTGYRPVNGGGYFERKIGDEWVPVGGEE